MLEVPIKKVQLELEIEQVYRNLFFWNFILLWKAYEEAREKNYNEDLFEYENFNNI